MLELVITWLPVAAKLLLTALIVLAASITTERAGPFMGALVVTLPVTFWPAYLFLSLDHDTAFVADSAVAGMVMHAVSGVMMLIYVVLAQRRSLFVSLGAAVAFWLVVGTLAKQSTWTFTQALVIDVVVYAACLWLVRPYRHAKMPVTQRRWYDVPVRVTLVCVLMGTILLASAWAGPAVSGALAVFPIASIGTALIMHPRIGGKAAAAMIANGVRGMVGLGLAIIALHLSVVPFGAAVGLTLLLAIPVSWNLTTFLTRARPARA